MTNYPALLDNMMQAILSGDTKSASTLYREKPDFSSEDQLKVYVHGYRIRLQKIVRNTYPATHHYLGTDNFKVMVRNFITTSPSHFYNIDRYACMFGQFLAEHSSDEFASELAILEGVLRETYYLPETTALEHEWLAKQKPDAITSIPFRLRAASCLLALNYAVSEYIDAFRADKKPHKPEQKATWLIVVRDQDHMHRVSLEEAEYVMLSLIADGNTLGAALASEQFAPYTSDPKVADSFQQWFARWINEGLLTMPISPRD